MKTQKALLAGGALLLAAAIQPSPVEAHNWGCWRQPDRTVRAFVTASRSAQANAALSEWDSKTILAIPRMSSHTDISVLDGNYGNTGWGGLASIESSSGCTILHGHARVNLFYPASSNAIRGIFCQEVGHLFGLTHSNDGGCMGGGYFYPIGTFPGYTVVSHNVSDIQAKYSGTPLAPNHDEDGEGQPNAHATWHNRPQTLAQALRLSGTVVMARVTAVTEGADLVVPARGLENDEDRVPTQRITFQVKSTLAGNVESTFELFHTGNADFVVDEDPPYKAGQAYLLFLTPRGDGTYRLISPEGRFELTKAGVQPMAHGGYAGHMQGLSLGDVTTDIRQILDRAK